MGSGAAEMSLTRREAINTATKALAALPLAATIGELAGVSEIAQMLGQRTVLPVIICPEGYSIETVRMPKERIQDYDRQRIAQ